MTGRALGSTSYFNATDSERWPLLANYRTVLTKALHELQIYKHRKIFDPILQSDRPERMTVMQLKVECVLIGTEYQAYTTKWTSADVRTRWPEYRLAALSMMSRIREGLAKQDDAIRNLYSQPGPHLQ